MPFTKVGSNRYKSPSGKIMTGEQVKAYYAKQKPKRGQRVKNNRKKKK